MDWEQEEVPDRAELYMRAHRRWFFPTGELNPGVFRDQGDGMSTDWDKYSTPQETQGRARNPGDNAVLAMETAMVRAIPGQAVVHTPIAPDLDAGTPGNRAHTDVRGDKRSIAVRKEFMRIYRLRIPLP